MVYCWPTRTAPTPIIRRFGPSMTVVGPGTGLMKPLGTAFGIGRGGCGAGAAPFFIAGLLGITVLVGSLRNAMCVSCALVYRGGALGAHVKEVFVRHQGADVQLVP